MEVWSFFSGAMGLDLGLQQAGIKTTLAVECDKWCCATIKQNMPDVMLIEHDVHVLTGAMLRSMRMCSEDVWLMVGGPPCQSFSPGGKRAALADPRGNLIYAFFRLIAEIKPAYFIFENVANLATAALRHRPIKERPGKQWSLKKYSEKATPTEAGVRPLEPDELSGSALRQLLNDISLLDYSVNFGVIDAADYGAPQHRLRFIMMGAKDGPAPPLPQPTHGKPSSRRPTFATVREAIYDLREHPGLHSVYTPQMEYYFSLIPEGGTWRDLPAALQKEAMGASFYAGGGKTGFFRRLMWDAPAPTITGKPNRKGSAVCHPELHRPLSVRECARLQGFPDHWEFQGAMNQQYLQIGNAVPVQLGKAVGTALLAREQMTDAHKLSQSTAPSIDQMFATAVKRLRESARNKSSSSNMVQTQFEW